MVKKAELRLGWAFRRNRQNIILTDADMLELLGKPGRYAVLAPVHLTPKLLRRLGLKDRRRCLDLYHRTSKAYIHLRFHIACQADQEFIVRARFNGTEWDEPFYMHKLQQLYFDTIGENLHFDRSVFRDG
jgi:hypothetical protein